MTSTPFVRRNLLTWLPLRRTLMSAWFPLVLQVFALIGMTTLALNGWGLGADLPAKDLMTLRKTNATTLAVWGLWWPGMIVVAPARRSGRIPALPYPPAGSS